MAIISDLTDVYPTVLRPFPRDRRAIHRICDAVEALSRAKPERTQLENYLKYYRTQCENAPNAVALNELTLLCNHLNWLLDTLYLSDGSRFPINRQDRTQLPVNTGDVIATGDELSFDLASVESKVWRANGVTGMYRRDIFDAVHDQNFLQPVLDEISSVWVDRDILVTPYSLDENLIKRSRFLAFMHKQFTQNALTHALANGMHNENFQSRFRDFVKLGYGDFVFGSLAYLEVSFIELSGRSRKNAAEKVDAFSRLILQSDPEYLDRVERTHGRIVAFSYCDTGPGIERHVREFGPHRQSLPEGLNIKSIIDNNIVGRRKLKAGFGLSDVRRLAAGVKAKFLVETQHSTYLYDGHTQRDRVENISRLSRGTSATVLLEV